MSQLNKFEIIIGKEEIIEIFQVKWNNILNSSW